MIRGSLLAACAALAAAAGGCAQDAGGGPPNPVAEADHVDLLVNPPVALNLDGAPGPDGARVELFFFRRDRDPAQLVSGELEIRMYAPAGPLRREDVAELLATPPVKRWTFGPDRLRRARFRHRLGLWGYRLTLNWAPHEPAVARVVLIAAYHSPSGPTVYSAPANVETKVR